MKKSILLVNLLLVSIAAIAQDTIPDFKRAATEKIRAEFPRARILNFEYNQSFARDFDSEIFGDAFQEGQIQSQRSFNAAINLPFYRNKKLVVTASANYDFNEFKFDGLENVSLTSPFEQNGTVDFHNFSTALSATYFSKLFKKPVIYNTSIIADGNDKGFQRLKGLIGASLIIKKTERTTMTLGVIVFVDRTAQIPFFPTFTYNHQFKNSEWEFDFILPSRVLLRRPLGSNGRISLGTTFGGTGFYANVDSPNLPDVFEYSQLEINTGLIYEHRISYNMVATVKGGMTSFLSNRLTEKGEPNKDFIYKNNQEATGYFNLGFSFNPFANKNP
tara:strand:+ start:8921 stop:9916 length:996 start_codon:yes stop_codon:yes gene_type:complete